MSPVESAILWKAVPGIGALYTVYGVLKDEESIVVELVPFENYGTASAF